MSTAETGKSRGSGCTRRIEADAHAGEGGREPLTAIRLIEPGHHAGLLVPHSETEPQELRVLALKGLGDLWVAHQIGPNESIDRYPGLASH